LHPNPVFAPQIQAFFLGCVAVAGAYGAATVGKKILYIQFIPAAVGLSAVLLGL
jgi:putative membrane protein